MSALARHAATVIRQEAALRGWSPRRLCAEANIRRVALKGRKPIKLSEVGRAGILLGIGDFPLLFKVFEDAPEPRARRRVR